MVHRLSRIAVGAVLAAGLVAAPAQAAPHASSRIEVKLRAAERALDRASDSDSSATTVSALATVRRNLAAAEKTALRKPTPSTFARLASVEGDVVTGTSALYDGATGDTVTALSTTLKAALDGRDSIVAAINALAEKSDYVDVLDRIHSDATDEASDIADTLTDDELTDEAKTALNAATTQLTATAAAAPAASGSDGSSDYPGGSGSGNASGKPCPDGPRGGGGGGAGQGQGGDYPRGGGR